MEAEKAAYKAEPVVEEETIGVKVCPVCGAVSEDKFCPTAAHPWATESYGTEPQKRTTRTGLFFFCAFYRFTHFSEEEIPMSSRSASRALSTFHVMVLPLRVWLTDSSAVKPLPLSPRYSRPFSAL